ncbi:MAG: glycosyltransferase family 2 protein, partial [Bacteroidetes bacterium]|nr:glycosyltransferase family 2 protein [Bacteroidota bacterium]
MRKLPLISICIPVYQKKEKLRRLLRSIAIQTFTEYEIIVSDDSPTDEMEQLLPEFPSLNILYHRNTPSLGVPANWNRAVSQARGEWIKIMHDDDWFSSPSVLEQFARAAIENTAGFIFCGYTRFHELTAKKVAVTLKKRELSALNRSPFCLFENNLIGHPSVTMYKREPLLQYDERYKWVVDISFYMRYLQARPGIVY